MTQMHTANNKIENRRVLMLLFGLCWAVYFASYLARLNYSAVMSELIGTRLSKEQAGWISTAYLAAYAAGQLINGMLADRTSSNRMVLMGLGLGAISSLLFPLVEGFGGMLLLRLVTGYAMSSLWPPILKVFAQFMQPKDRVRYSVHLVSSMASGTLCSYLLSAWMLDTLGWQAAFYVPAALLVVVAGLWLILFRRVQRYAGTHGVPEVQNDPGGADKAPVQQERISMGKLLLMPGILALFVPVALHGVLKDGATAWMPTYITEVFAVTPALSSLVLTLLPIVNLSGAYLAHWVYTHITGSEQRAAAVFFAVASVALAVLLAFGGQSLVLTLVLFALMTSSMLAVNTLFISILPLRYQHVGRTATLSGLLNAVAYGGSALASGVIGLVSSRWGWGSAVASWLVCMVIALTVCLLSGRPRRTG